MVQQTKNVPYINFLCKFLNFGIHFLSIFSIFGIFVFLWFFLFDILMGNFIKLIFCTKFWALQDFFLFCYWICDFSFYLLKNVNVGTKIKGLEIIYWIIDMENGAIYMLDWILECKCLVLKGVFWFMGTFKSDSNVDINWNSQNVICLMYQLDKKSSESESSTFMHISSAKGWWNKPRSVLTA